MNGSLQRIEVLLIGLSLLLAGAVMLLASTVRPLVPGSATRSAEPVATVAQTPPASARTPLAPTATATPPAMPDRGRGDGQRLTIPRTLWPLLLMASCLGLSLAVRRARKRRMPYTHQSVGQLLATADVATRATNVRVMRALAAQGLLTADLAAAAGIGLRQQTRHRWSVPCPRVRWPWHVRLTLRWPGIRWRRLAGFVYRTLSVWFRQSAAAASRIRRAASSETPGHAGERANELAPVSAASPIAPAWTADDRALVVATALAELWQELHLRSPITAFDAPRGAGPVYVTVDAHPDEEQALTELPDLLVARRPAWRMLWRRSQLEVTLTPDGTPPAGGPLLVPALAHGRGGLLTRFLPLAAWPHLEISGGAAPGALHTMLASLLYAQPPSAIALAIIDRGEIAPLYRNIEHLAPLPDTRHATLERLSQALRHGAWGDLRRLILVVIEPDDAQLSLLASLLARLQARPEAPLHLIVVQKRPASAGHEPYAQLPRLLAAGDHDREARHLDPRSWARPGPARLLARGMRLEGWPLTLDESALSALLLPLRGAVAERAPVLWDRLDAQQGAPAPPIAGDPPAGARSWEPDAIDASSAEIGDSLDEQKQRIIAAITRRRRQLLAIEDAAASTVAPASGPAPQTENPPLDARVDCTLLALGTPVALNAAAPSRRAELLRATRESGDVSAPAVLAYRRPASEAATNVPPLGPRPAPPEEPDNGWPFGPAPLGRAAMAELLARVVSAPAITSGLPNERGLTKNRLAEQIQLPAAQAKALAETLLAWFDLAGLLVEPTQPERLRHPRAFKTTDLAEIAALLHATACPDQTSVQALWARADERND